jgi:hypothetical protein
MTRKAILIREAENVPDALLDETLDYLRFLKARYTRAKSSLHVEPMLLSEALLARDWLHPEEDEAWKDL